MRHPFSKTLGEEPFWWDSSPSGAIMLLGWGFCWKYFYASFIVIFILCCGTAGQLLLSFFFFQPTLSGKWKFLGQGMNWYYSSDLKHCSGNAGSLTPWFTSEFHVCMCVYVCVFQRNWPIWRYVFVESVGGESSGYSSAAILNGLLNWSLEVAGLKDPQWTH